MKHSRREARGANSRQVVGLPVWSLLLLRPRLPVAHGTAGKARFHDVPLSVTSNKYTTQILTEPAVHQL